MLGQAASSLTHFLFTSHYPVHTSEGVHTHMQLLQLTRDMEQLDHKPEHKGHTVSRLSYKVKR